MSIERRTISAASLRASDGDEPSIMGYASTFGNLSQDLGGFREVVAAGAFSASLANGADVKCLFNHNPSQILGRRSAGTLQVREDAKGLLFRCTLDESNTDHMNLRASILRGDISQCSFAFTVPDGGDEWSEATDENGVRFIRRTLRNVNLLDVSAVTYPAYDAPNATVVQARAANVHKDNTLLEKVLAMPGDWERAERLAAIAVEVARG